MITARLQGKLKKYYLTLDITKACIITLSRYVAISYPFQIFLRTTKWTTRLFPSANTRENVRRKKWTQKRGRYSANKKQCIFTDYTSRILKNHFLYPNLKAAKSRKLIRNISTVYFGNLPELTKKNYWIKSSFRQF